MSSLIRLSHISNHDYYNPDLKVSQADPVRTERDVPKGVLAPFGDTIVTLFRKMDEEVLDQGAMGDGKALVIAGQPLQSDQNQTARKKAWQGEAPGDEFQLFSDELSGLLMAGLFQCERKARKTAQVTFEELAGVQLALLEVLPFGAPGGVDASLLGCMLTVVESFCWQEPEVFAGKPAQPFIVIELRGRIRHALEPVTANCKGRAGDKDMPGQDLFRPSLLDPLLFLWIEIMR